MRIAGGDKDDVQEWPFAGFVRAHVHRRWVRGEEIVRRSAPQLPVLVAAPALHVAVRRERARVRVAGVDGGDRAGQPLDVGGRVAFDRRAIADLADHVVAPALDAAIGREHAVVPVSRSYRGDILRGGRLRRSETEQH